MLKTLSFILIHSCFIVINHRKFNVIKIIYKLNTFTTNVLNKFKWLNYESKIIPMSLKV